jgi:hypothetical protein
LTFKPQLVPVLVLSLAVRRQWRVLGTAAAVAVGLWLPAMAWLGPSGLRRYMDVTGRMAAASGTLGVHPGQMFNLRALWLAIPSSAGMPAAGWWLAAACVAGAAAALHRRPDDRRAPLAWIGTVLAMLLVAPHLNLHDLTLLLLPVALILGRWVFGPRSPESSPRVTTPRLTAAVALAQLPLLGAARAVSAGSPTAVAAMMLAALAGVICLSHRISDG